MNNPGKILKLILISVLSFLSAVHLQAGEYSIDFSEYAYTGYDELTDELIYGYIKGDSEAIDGFSCHGATINYSGNTPSQYKFKGICLYSAKGNEAEMSFHVNPLYSIIPNMISVRACEYSSFQSDDKLYSEIELSVNGGAYTTLECNSGTNLRYVRFPLTETDPIETFSIRIPYPNDDIADEYIVRDDYMLIINQISILWDDVALQPVEQWEYAVGTHTCYLDEEYEMPELIAMPRFAAQMAALTSSDPEVAEIENGKIMLQKEGSTTITASIADNKLYTGKNVAPASYELIVEKSRGSQTNVISIEEAEADYSGIYDLQGREITGNPTAGIYIMINNGNARKIIVR